MSKKNFKDNPALQFMSKPEIIIKEITQAKDEQKLRGVNGVVPNSFVQKFVPFEAKSKRFNMLIRPSVFVRLKNEAENKGTSINNLINTILELYLEKE